MDCRIFHDLYYMRASESPFSKLQVKANFVFRQFNSFLSFRAQSAKKTYLHFAILSYSEKL